MTPETQEQNQEQAQLQTRNDSQAKHDKARDKAFIQSHYRSNKLYNLEAIRLWLQGEEAWNKWTEQNPECDVDFSGVDFGEFIKRKEVERISFSFFTFPKGKVNFSRAQFGDGYVDFEYAEFGDGYINFNNALFGDGDVDFENVRFGNGEVSFIEVQFGDGDAIFCNARFGDGDVSFSGAQFGNGDVDFSGADFGEGTTNFQTVDFGRGNIDFSNTRFREGDVTFDYAQFGNGSVSFYGAEFGEGTTDFKAVDFGSGNIDFSSTRFGKGTANFSATRFGMGAVDFQLIECQGNLLLRNLHAPQTMTSLSLSGASIDGLLSISNNAFNCVPDLTVTNIKHDIELQTLKATLPRKRADWKGLWAKKAINYSDIERLRKLKQIAESNKHHDAAQRFHADEMRARRWQNKEHGGFGFFGSVLDLLYSAMCNYGQSILQPVIGLVLSWGMFFAVYFNLIKNELSGGYSIDLLVFTATNSIPFIPVAKTVREIAYRELFDTGPLLFTTMSAQAVVSFVFIFLIGLGVRNRFRI